MDFGKWIHQRILLLRSLSLPRSPFSLKALKLWGDGDSVQWNVRTPRFPAPVPAWLPANLGPLCRLKTWTPSSASPAAAPEPRPSSAIAILRPTSLGLALQSLVQLALCPAHCEARDRHRLASPRLSALLGSEESCTKWSPLPGSRSARFDPPDESRQPSLGRASHPWRVAQAGHRSEPGYCSQVHGQIEHRL